MKKHSFYYSLLIGSMLVGMLSQPLQAALREWGIAFLDMTKALANGSKELFEAKLAQIAAQEDNVKEEVAQIEARLQGTYTNNELKNSDIKKLADLNEQLKYFEEDRKRTNDAAYAAASNIGSTTLELIKKKTESSITEQKDLREAKIKADAIRQGIVDSVKTFLSWRTGLLVTGIAAALFGMKYAYDHFDDPTLAQETSMKPLHQRLLNLLMGIKDPQPKNLHNVILDPVLQAQLDRIGVALKYAVANGAPLPNVLFYGPPGTGKTMFAKELAWYSGMNFIYISAADLMQQSLEEALKTIRHLFAQAKASGKPVMIIIDECEELFKNRNKDASEKTRYILSLLLSLTGDTANRDSMMVGITNRYHDLDDAAHSRFGKQVYVGVPNTQERKRIFKKYIHDFLLTTNSIKKQPSLLDYVMGTKQKPPRKIQIETGALDDAALDEIVARTEGFSGRDISKLILDLQMAAYGTKACTVTKDIVAEIVAEKVAQFQKMNALHGPSKIGYAAPAA